MKQLTETGPVPDFSRERALRAPRAWLMASTSDVAATNARLCEERRRVVQLDRLCFVSRQISRLRGLDDLFPTMIELVRDQLGYKWVEVHLLENGAGKQNTDERAEGSLKAGGVAGGAGRPRAAGRSPREYVARNSEALQICRAEMLVPEWVEFLPPDVQVMLLAPLRIGRDVVGILEVGSRTQTAFDEDEANVLEALADQLAIALENAWLYAEIERLAATDGMTGAYNVRYFYQALDREVVRSRRYGQDTSILICDLDDFKAINDRFGHLAGDDVLRQVARLLQEACRESDLVARYGGDEFAVILTQTGQQEAQRVVSRLQEEIRTHPFDVGGQFLGEQLTISIGMAGFPHDGADAQSLVRAADERLYQEKGRKR